MRADCSLLGVELLVADLDRSIELFREVLGFPVLHQGEAEHVRGRVATIDAGSIVITLLEPASSGDGAILTDRHPRLGQLIVGAPDVAAVAGALDRTARSGLAAVPSGPDRFHLTPESVEGALGQPVAVVVTLVDTQ